MDTQLIMDQLIRHLKFPMQLDKAKLKEDLQKVMATNWIGHYNTNDYSGDWSSVALMSGDGKSDNIYALNQGNGPIKSTEILESCLYFKQILEEFKFDKTAVRLLRLAVGAEVKPHSDYCLGYEDGCFRMHIPIVTNSDVEFILDEERIIMNEGECWYIDANFTHSVANRGTEDRIHLVIDGVRNDWTDDLFFQQADATHFIKPVIDFSDEQKDLIIEELKRMNLPVSQELIANLKKKE
ncbi:aspartyl/asparaginyl beta-hydroxylase domain-containing protein [Flavobacterium amniphilum]|uniref:aspartyl/asparaginyl beta-hydroxylase domain-containing protein n=1 Tax=Flavobacterium amniphilum TaxID=1834035 RepID=UPI00202A9E9D|nr:aspartyl/asparaginyl beta-hydroxylase domain-containing protein [Flavobacterium amniphilum]MCL9805258.1 aspartyl/asparaginyl beta-hydroxylase domain-containing protein [Flavobacterium amniphilum]